VNLARRRKKRSKQKIVRLLEQHGATRQKIESLAI